MYWNENLYRLHQSQKGKFFGTLEAVDGMDPMPDGTLFLLYRDRKLIVRADYDVSMLQMTGGPRGATLWAGVSTEVTLPRRCTLKLCPQKGLSALLNRNRTEDDGRGNWQPAGYQVKTDDTEFARRLLSHQTLRAMLRSCREMGPAPLPLFLNVLPLEQTGNAHLLQVRTNLFRDYWVTLKGLGARGAVLSSRQVEEASLILLERLVETEKAACDAVDDLPA